MSWHCYVLADRSGAFVAMAEAADRDIKRDYLAAAQRAASARLRDMAWR
jgi:hypothetical protein